MRRPDEWALRDTIAPPRRRSTAPPRLLQRICPSKFSWLPFLMHGADIRVSRSSGRSESRRDAVNELLELTDFIGAGKRPAQLAPPRRFVALERRDHFRYGSQPHQTA